MDRQNLPTGLENVQLYCLVKPRFIIKIFRRACPGSGIQVAATQFPACILIFPGIASGDSGKNTGGFSGKM